MSTESVAAAVRDSIAARKGIRTSGGGSWMTAGRPVNASETVSLAADKGIVDYVPDDLTITVRAGTTLEEIAAAAAANNQWLPLDPLGGEAATIGATVATASSGPLAHGSGFARDFILGLEFVTGKGEVVRSGGRVVKNVAGFDMMRLMCGAWGTLGIITQASLRLYARPKVDRTFSLRVPDGDERAKTFLHTLRNAPLSALAMELVHAALAPALGLETGDAVLIRLAGNPTLVDAQIKTLSSLGSPKEAPSGIWEALRKIHDRPWDVSLRLSGLAAGIHETWLAGRRILEAAESGYLHSTFSHGLVRVVANQLRGGFDLPKAVPCALAYEILPNARWSETSPSVTSDALSRNVQRAFDPHSLLNPGILG